MGEPIFISICIPAYRRPDDLRRLLDSVSAQSYRYFEVVITDDSPGDEVLSLVEIHPLKPMIRYFKNSPALGTPENWNEGIRRAKGAWIKLMHDDDWFRDAGSLAVFADHVVRHPANFYFSAYENVLPDNTGKPVRAPGIFLRRLNRNPEILLAANRIGPPSVVLFRNDPEIFSDRRLKWLVDLDFYIRYLKLHPPAVYIPQTLVCIGISKGQVTQTSFGNRSVEIPERFMVWEKMFSSSIRNMLIYDSWWRFVRNLKIEDQDDIRAAGYSGPIPSFVLSMMRWQHRIPRGLLRAGLFSKIIMILHYLTGQGSHARHGD